MEAREGAGDESSRGRRFVERIGPAVRQAAAIARALEGRVRNQPKSGENSAIKAAMTIADSAAQEAILVPLLEHFPEVSLEAEEDTPNVAGFGPGHPLSVVIDPIDGTLQSYLEGRGPYAVIAGLADEAGYLGGLVALPREGLFLDAVRGGGARRTRPLGSPRPARVRTDPDGARRVLVSHGLPEAGRDVLKDAGLEPLGGCGGAISVAPVLPSVRGGLRLLPEGGSISVRGRVGALIAREAGALVQMEGGAPFPLDLRTPARALVVAASQADAEILHRAVAASI
ncbi:MAG: inositol monophosphatase family protein [Myxococcota bacterium]|nr:inositol monophosphatase family protein [Myxococcota bacterium]